MCGFDLNLTYPQHGHFPTFNPPSAQSDTSERTAKKTVLREALKVGSSLAEDLIEARGVTGELPHKRQWRRDLAGRANGTIDPWYGCDIFDEMIDYALNFSFPWSTC